MKNKIFTILIAFVASVTFANAEVYNGTCGTNLTWSLNTEDSTLTIEGTGAMNNWKYNAPWNSYRATIKNVVLPEGLTSIGDYAFYFCSNLISVVIPDGVKTIGERAFNSCENLTSIRIPNSVTSIGNYAFSLCWSIGSLSVPNSVKSIGTNAFGYIHNVIYNGTATGSPWSAQCINGYIEGSLVYQNSSKTTLCACLPNATGEIIIPNSVYTIKYYAFEYCKGITSVIIPESITEIPREAFSDCENIVSIDIPNTVTSIEREAFQRCKRLQSITIPDGVTEIKAAVFRGCNSLTSITLSKNTTSIGNMAFAACNSLASIVLPQQVDSIDSWAFEACTSLASITSEATTPPFIFTSTFPSYDIPLYVPSESVESYKAANGWKDFVNILPIPGTEVCESQTLHDTIWFCLGEDLSWLDRTFPIDEPGIYDFYDSLVSVNGCDSVRHWHVYAGRTSRSIHEYSICEGNYFDFMGQRIDESGIYYDTVMNITGCDSIVELHLTVNHKSYEEKYDTIYEGETHYAMIQGESYGNGYYVCRYKTEMGCDSFIVWNIYVNPLPRYTVIFLDYNSNVLSEQKVAYDQAAKTPQVPGREGYEFAGWNVDIEHIVAPTYAIALYDKIGGTVTYLSEEGDVIASENVDLHLPAAPIIAGKSFKGWLTESADSENGIVLRATYTSDNPTTSEDVTVTPSSTSADVSFPFITGALTYELVIRDLSGNVVCKIMFNSFGQLLGIAFAPSRNRNQQATQSTGFNFTVEGLNASTTYSYEFVAYDDTDDVIETLSGSFTTTADTPTNIDNASAANAPQKYIQDGHLFIDNNNRTFDARGQQMR